jgi:GTP-binding protein Era
MHKAGFVNIVGNPNAGKSTLMNQLVGERLSIITSKAQTTRHRIMGIVNGENFQIIYSDTPGILKPKYKLQEGMMQFVGSALADADVLLFVVDLTDDELPDEHAFNKIKNAQVPVFVVLNKTDAVKEERVNERSEFWKKELPGGIQFRLSALKGDYLDKLLEAIINTLPEHPAYYPKDELTDKPERFFVAEIVREKILELYSQEIPYAVEVVVEDFKESETIIKIRAIIFCERETQKGILLGHQGKAIKKMGTAARLAMETFLQKKVFLDLHIKVDKQWRSSERELKRFGYLQ